MHTALLIPEIKSQIFDLILKDDDELVDASPTQGFETSRATCQRSDCPNNRHSLSSLLSIALTCHAFEDSALDIMWADMTDLVPLFEVVMKHQNAKVTASISEPLDQANCDRFLLYARRIKSFCLGHQNSSSPSISSFIQMSQALGMTCILPSLVYLHCVQAGPELHFCASATLRRVVIDTTWRTLDVYIIPRVLSLLEEATNALSAFLSSLRYTSPYLQSLDIDAYIPISTIKYIPQIPGLVKLRFDNNIRQRGSEHTPIGDDFFLGLAKSSTISDCSLSGAISFVLRKSAAEVVYTFSSLERLDLASEITSSTLTQITRLLRVSRFPVLRYFHILIGPHQVSAGPEQTESEWSEFFQNLTQATTRGTFDALHISLNEGIDVTGPRTTISYPAILDLRHFSMPFFSPMSTEDIDVVAQTWPNLTSLALESYSYADLKFPVLVKLACDLPHLTSLSIFSLSLADQPNIAHTPILDHQLTCLNITLKSFMHCDLHCFTTCIDRIFPHLSLEMCTIGLIGSIVSVGRYNWEGVLATITALQRVRKDQKARDFRRIQSDT